MRKIIVALLLISCLVGVAGCANTDGTPDGMQNVALESAAYNLYVPESWVANTYNMSGAKATPDENAPNVLVTVHYPEDTVTPEIYWSTYSLPEHTTVLPSFTVIEEGTAATLGGKDAKSYRFSYTFGETLYQCRQVITVFDFKVYVLTYTAVSTEYDTYAGDVDGIVSNFTFK